MSNEFQKKWQLADSVSLPHAAVLMLGEDPENGIANLERGEMWRSYCFDGYDSVVSILKSAICKGSLKAKLAYQALSPTDDMDHARSLVILESGSLDALHSNEEVLSLGEVLSTELADKIIIEREPLWRKTMIDVDDLKQWLKLKKYTDEFFVTEETRDDDDFMNTEHPHFAPELALAVSAWKALALEQNSKLSSKAMIKKWITQNSNTWKGHKPISENTKERVSMVANWNKTGGPPSTSGK